MSSRRGFLGASAAAAPELRRLGLLSYASAIDNCLWEALGKAVNLPVRSPGWAWNSTAPCSTG
jgi:hypothetical protein